MDPAKLKGIRMANSNVLQGNLIIPRAMQLQCLAYCFAEQHSVRAVWLCCIVTKLSPSGSTPGVDQLGSRPQGVALGYIESTGAEIEYSLPMNGTPNLSGHAESDSRLAPRPSSETQRDCDTRRLQCTICALYYLLLH